MREVTSVFMEEEMNESELDFLKSKIKKEQRLFFRTMRSFFLVGFMIPTVIAVVYFSNDQEKNANLYTEKIEPFTLQHYFFSLIFLLGLISLMGLLAYFQTIQSLKKDKKEKTKIIEKTWITRKYFMELNGFYYFYLKSKIKVSIEVEKKDFVDYREGDEINIEYSKYAKEFFGYF